MNSDITELGELDADEIVIATGGTAKRLPVPGGEKCVSIEDALRGRFKLGDDIVIIGGGLAGCELAYDLAVKGNRPAIIEAQDDLIRGMNVSAPNSVLMRFLTGRGKLAAGDPEIMAAQLCQPVSVWINLCDREPEREDEVMALIERHVRCFFRLYRPAE